LWSIDKRSPIDLRRLDIFLAVVEEGGFSAAADRLDITQPAVSQAIRELEQALGADLFLRLGRKVRLTAAGEALLEPARRTQRDVDIARSAVAEVAGVGAGRLDIACLPTLAVAPLASLVGDFRAAHPGVAIALADPTDTAELVELVGSGRSEVGLVEEVHVEGLTTVSIGEQDFLVVLPPGSPRRDRFPLEELADLALVAPPAGSSTRGLLDQTLAPAGRSPHIVVEAAQREALLPLIVAGSGAGLLPRPLAEVGRGLGCVVVEPQPPVARSIALIYRNGPLTPAARRFVELAGSAHSR
jgi:LysR family transcriptional regulator, carnitine catabolism transcriptional activator